MTATIKQTQQDGFEAWHLANDVMSLTVIPALGGKLSSICSRLTRREWLWTNPYLPRQQASYTDSYVEKHDTGGADECFPTVDACICPAQAAPWDGITLPDHGELIHQTWQLREASVRDNGAAVLTLEALGVRMPYRFLRTLTLAPADGALSIDYELTNLSPHPLPWTWCIHPALNIEPEMQIRLPQGTPTRCAFGFGPMPAAAGENFVWPTTGSGYDLSQVPDPEQDSFTMKLFAGPLAEGQVALAAKEEALTFRFDHESVAHVAIWLNYAGWTGADTPNLFNAVIEPSIGDADSLTEAITERHTARWLAPAEKTTWQLRLAVEPT